MEDLAIKGIELFSKGFEFVSDHAGELLQIKEYPAVFWFKLSAAALSFLAALLTFYRIFRGFLRRKMLEILVDPIAFWNKKPSRKRRKLYQKNREGSIPIIAIADFKGGTGKSTIASNLAACLDQEGARVLVLDLGHNTTLSHMMPMDAKAKGFAYSAHDILKGKKTYYRPEKLTGSFQHSFIYPAMEDLREDDLKLEFHRLIGSEKKDIRFSVHDYLSQGRIQKQFDIVIIDMPARLSTAAANALCASTHVLVPTVLDMATLPVTIKTLDMIKDYRKSLKLDFRFLGVVPSMVASSIGLAPMERQALAELQNELENRFAQLLIPGTRQREHLNALNIWIASKVALRHQPGQDLPFFTSNNVNLSAMFDNLRRQLEDQLLGQGFKLHYLEKNAADAARALENLPPVVQVPSAQLRNGALPDIAAAVAIEASVGQQAATLTLPSTNRERPATAVTQEELEALKQAMEMDDMPKQQKQAS